MSDENAIDRLLDLLERRRPLLTTAPRDDLMPRQFAAAGLTLAESHLRAIRTLARAGQIPACGMFHRPIWECWCVSLYLLFKGEPAVVEFWRHFSYRLGQIQREWPAHAPHPLEDLDHDADAPYAEWNLRAIADTVETALRTTNPSGPLRRTETSTYSTLFRFGSTFVSHATYPAFNRHLDIGEESDPVGIDPAPTSGLPPDGGEAFCALMIAELAYHVFDAFGIGLAEITDLLPELFRAGNAWGEGE